ncbi:MAG: dihydrodipicolinate synthase family protein [Clostridia bacterium]|nr:dihydrodipicolinate synthase family protein [Clostridia bacterium]
MSRILFRGIMPALITPIDENRQVKKEAVKALMDYQYSKGVKGFYINGSTGEGPAIAAATRMEMAETAVAVNAGRGVIINHIASPNFEDAIALARHADTIDVDAISALAPNFYFNYTPSEIVDYYKALTEACKKPLLVYATPSIPGDIVSLMEKVTSLPGVIGLKFTRMSYYELSLIKQLHLGDINVINGPDEMLLAGLSMGADGGIGSTYNVMPERFVALYDAFRQGNMVEAQRIQYAINRVIKVLLDHGRGNVVKSVKEALLLMGFDSGYAASPAAPFTAEEKAALKADLIAAGLEL